MICFPIHKGIHIYRKFNPTSTAGRLVDTLARTIRRRTIDSGAAAAESTIEKLIKSTWLQSESPAQITLKMVTMPLEAWSWCSMPLEAFVPSFG
jgi:hypothetical protein